MGIPKSGTETGAMFIRGVLPKGFGSKPASAIDISIDGDGRIIDVGPSLAPQEGQAVLDAAGSYISPGWIDLHTHVYEAVRAGIDPDRIGPRTGVTRVVDVGSAGEASFAGFRTYVLDRVEYPVECFLNIGSSGIGPYTPEGINLLRASECIGANRDHIRGVKVLGSKKFIGGVWTQPVVAAKRLAADMNLPVMVHVAEPPVYIEELVEILGSGDIITHCFHGKVGNSVRSSEERIIPLYKRALEKGIHLDVGHGAASFSLLSASAAIRRGVKPTTVSTDIHTGNIDGPVGSLAAVMSKMVACGMSIEEVLAGVTTTPAAILDRSGYGSLAAGELADFTLFSIEKGDYTFYDAGAIDDLTSGSDPRYQQTFQGSVAFKPTWAIWAANRREVDDLDLTGGR